MKPLRMIVDGSGPSTCPIMGLAEMLLQHAMAEPGIVPRDVVSLAPRSGHGHAFDEGHQVVGLTGALRQL